MAPILHRLLQTARRLRHHRTVDGAAPPQPSAMTQGEPDADRMHRLARWFTDGRAAAAELELWDWCRTADAPAPAHNLLAASFAVRHQYADAISVLASRLPATKASEALAVRLHAALSIAQRHESRASDQSLNNRLRDDITESARAIEPADDSKSDHHTSNASSRVNQLALELESAPDIIATLIAAQRTDPRDNEIALLRAALRQIEESWSRDADMLLRYCQAMAELAALAGDQDDARRWAHKGLGINPFSAPLAIIVSRLPDKPEVGPLAVDVLQTTAEAHPHYTDIRAALIRRARSDGRADLSRSVLRAWVAEQPDHPIALQLQREMAA